MAAVSAFPLRPIPTNANMMEFCWDKSETIWMLFIDAETKSTVVELEVPRDTLFDVIDGELYSRKKIT